MEYSKLKTILLVHSAIIIVALAVTGPHPSDIHPSSYASPDLAKVSIPAINKSSGQTTPPKISFVFLGVSYYTRPNYTMSVGIDDWRNSAGPLRYRLLEYRTRRTPYGTNVTSTHVLKAVVKSSTYYSSILKQGCKPLNLYIEICARLPVSIRPLCNMTEVKTLPPFRVPIPKLKFRPPHVLYLAPGDKARIRTESKPHSSGETYWVRSILQDKNKKTLYQTSQSPVRSDLFIPREYTRRLNGLYLNDSTVFHKYALRSCRSNEQYDWRYKGTKVYVDKTVKPLIRQDIRAPYFEQPKFPLVKQGVNVSININARNVGGGFRIGGTRTKLYYYWYIRTFIDLQSNYRPFRLVETSSTLRIQNAKCRYQRINSGGQWYGLQEYYVEVCNTYGCRISDIFEPHFVSNTPGKKISSGCLLVDINS